MLASPVRLQPAPSAGLLRFLRHQSELLFVTDDNSNGGSNSKKRLSRVPSASRKNSTTHCVSETAVPVLQASLIDLDTLIPKTLRARWRPATTPVPPIPRKPLNKMALLATPFSTSQPVQAFPWRRSDKRQKRAVGSPVARASWYDRAMDWHWAWHWRNSGPRDCADTQVGGSAGGRRSSLLPGDLPDHGAGAEFASVMFNARRLQTAKAALEPRLRCTEVDEYGEVILVDGEFKKTELIAKYGLLPRDLRKIDSSNLPHILVRPAAILLNLLHLKVLIKADRVLLFDVYGSKTSYPQSAFMYDLQGRLQQKQAPGAAGGLPYEFRALEAVLLSVTSELEADFDTVREPILRILSELEADITRDKLRVLLVLSKKVSTFEQKAKLVRDAIEELLEADDDLAAMYLTEKKHDLFRGEDDHTEVEMLLESYHKICDEVAQEAGSLVSSIRNTEEIVRAILDANRNALMLLDLKFSIGTLGLAMGTFLAGLYGMNLENFIEETNWGFGSVTGISFAFSLLVCWYGLVKLRKVQRVKMHGPSTASGSGGAAMTTADWANSFAALPPGVTSAGFANAPLDARSRERLRRLGMVREVLMRKKYY
ncbi:inner membrane magnesium transporter MRS2, mitochondrial precursor [Sporothrix schenckii 1099-18]|uniref:Magnesium transporter n=2 Tax=Sporothrix schenckii TaxID=29908 RepID=U7PZA3_SPOS1|nr:inner membrane magnesium transporter MRS2, mitochondrial precursor [Sporothrix schenckii 1099-18]ERT00065.1 mitochondrial inner membrane magnesium transporter mrs2 [Sporothrix schenckii ATCC 58251]KJR85503.1 inner membrane magnesium transporter MRS2, mitochondrial precursor [Sporothrix schenckii 1099-18]